MATYQETRDEAVLSAKNRIACIAAKNYEAGLNGEPVDDCCVQKVLFTYGLMRDLECYDLDDEDSNCYDFDDFLKGVQLLNGLLT
jgi:hypothetical protein